MTRIEAAAKRTVDVVVSASALVLLSPVLAATACAVRVTMGGPVLFRHRRPGLRGAPFDLVKFRTMRPTPPDEEAAATDAVRMTPLGRFLRDHSIDELPTLWNVLRGEMSLVGPRPLMMSYPDRYSPEQARRHLVKPGVTGWAQIHGRNSIDWDLKLALDVWYVDHASLWLDLRILWRTLGSVLRKEGISHGGYATMPEFRGSLHVGQPN